MFKIKAFVKSFRKPIMLRFSVAAILIFFVILSFTLDQMKNALPQGDPDNGGLFLPGDFQALVVSEGVGPARHLTVNSNGDIYVKLTAPEFGKGNVALRDENNDGKADLVTYFGNYTEDRGGGEYATEMRIHNGYLYFSSARVLYRQKLSPGKLVPEGDPEVMFTEDIEHGIHWHMTKPIAFDDMGNIFIPNGGPSDCCQDGNPNGLAGSPGLNPCPSLNEYAGIWRFDANKLNQTLKDGVRIATGLRSVVGMDWNPVDKSLYVVMHGRDNLHRLFPNLYDQWHSAVLPSEEFIKIKEGANVGWPYYYYDQIQQKILVNPEYGGDGKKQGKASEITKPVIGFPGHFAPDDLLFYHGDQFPARYKNGAFIAFHGSTNRAPYPQGGYFVCFVPFKNGIPSGPWEVFADGFAKVDPIVNTNNAVYRPVGLAVGPDGSLFISDANKGKIWRVMYKGNKATFGTAQLAAMVKRKVTASNIKNPDPINDNLDRGKVLPVAQLYTTYCSPCHQRNGGGDASRFPPLNGSEWVTGDKTKLISVILNGLTGTIDVKGATYNSIMPKHTFLKDEDIAQVLTYIRQNFGNNASPVTPEEVTAVRKNLK
jgi:glucose/arabinose dehydrogenase